MRKLLLGALLVVTGAMSFGQVISEVTGSGVGNGTATGKLSIESRGEVVDTTGKTLLVITPLESASTDGTSLVFNHGNITKGTEGTKLIATYEAKVIDGNNSNALLDGKFTSVLLLNGTPATKKKDVSLEVKDSSNSQLKLGDLEYTLSSNDEESTNLHRGTVYSQFDATTAKTTGTFLERSVGLQVTVSEVTITGGED